MTQDHETQGPVVVYVMGYGRSGSTLLDTILNNHPSVTSVGEVANLPDWVSREHPCACGALLESCTFWGPVLDRYRRAMGSEALEELERCQTRVERAPLYRRSDAVSQRYGELTNALFHAIRKVSGSTVIVDSSKSSRRAIGRPYALTAHAGLDLRPIFLRRDGRGVMWSGMRGAGSPEWESSRLPRSLIGLRTLLAWVYTNRRCERVIRGLSHSALPLWYEDLVSDTEAQLRRLGAFLDLDLSGVAQRIGRGEALAVAHNVSGNRLRYQRQVRIQPDREWESHLPMLHRWAYRLAPYRRPAPRSEGSTEGWKGPSSRHPAGSSS